MIRQDERGVTAPVEYVYTFAVATILIAGLIIAATNTAGDQRSRTLEAQMEVVSNQVVGSLEKMDRIASAHDPDGAVSALKIEQDLPEELLGGDYFVTITESGSTVEVTVSSSRNEETATTMTTLDTTSIDGGQQRVDGGEILIDYNGGRLEVTDV